MKKHSRTNVKYYFLCKKRHEVNARFKLNKNTIQKCVKYKQKRQNISEYNKHFPFFELIFIQKSIKLGLLYNKIRLFEVIPTKNLHFIKTMKENNTNH